MRTRYRFPILILALVFLTLPAAAQEGDTDADGVSDRADLCPVTLPGADPVADGCSALELVRSPEVVSGPAERTFADLAALLGRKRELAGAVSALEGARAAFGEGDSLVSSGEPCAGATEYAVGARHADAAVAAVAAYVGDLRARILEGEFDPRVETEDADHRDAMWHGWGLVLAQTEAAPAAAHRARAVFDSLCEAFGPPAELGGRIVEVDDARGVLRLDGGAVVGLSRKARAEIGIGTDAVIEALPASDGSYLAKDVDANGTFLVPIPDVEDLLPRCLHLRVAPAQRPAWLDPGVVPVLHDPLGYRHQDRLFLEHGMSLAAAHGECGVLGGDPDTIVASFVRYTMQIDVTFVHVITGKLEHMTIADDLRPGDAPVSLPPAISPKNLAQLRVEVRRQVCSAVFILGEPPACTTPQTMSVDYHSATVKDRGSYCTAEYDAVVFALDEGPGVPALPAHVVQVNRVPQVPADAVFEATGNDPEPTPHLVGIGEPFWIGKTDFYTQGQILQREYWGVDRPSGLAWPRLKGTRSGSAFWYVCDVPEIARDAVTICPTLPNSFYRLPWAGGDDHSVIQGNNSGGTHSGTAQYAFDFDLPDGAEIRAPRGGRVVYVYDDQTKTACNPWCAGNMLIIEHRDGGGDLSYSFFTHNKYKGALVAVNDVVERGDPVALVGSTGNAGGPHIHWGAHTTDAADPAPTVTKESRLEMMLKTGEHTYEYKSCYVPLTGEVLRSTNEP